MSPLPRPSSRTSTDMVAMREPFGTVSFIPQNLHPRLNIADGRHVDQNQIICGNLNREVETELDVTPLEEDSAESDSDSDYE